MDELDNICNNSTRNIALSIFHFNIRSLNKNSSELFQFIQSINHDFDILVLSEIWTYNIQLYCNLFAGYTFYYDLPLSGSVGGIGIYVKNNLTQIQLDKLKIKSTSDNRIENIWLEICKGKQKYLIDGMYRHPRQDITKFSETMETNIAELRKTKLPCFIDINIDLTKYSIHSATSNYLENLLLYNAIPTVVMPTRITDHSATIIDHIYFLPGINTNPQMTIQSGNLWCDITDHLPNFCLLRNDNNTI